MPIWTWRGGIWKNSRVANGDGRWLNMNKRRRFKAHRRRKLRKWLREQLNAISPWYRHSLLVMGTPIVMTVRDHFPDLPTAEMMGLKDRGPITIRGEWNP